MDAWALLAVLGLPLPKGFLGPQKLDITVCGPVCLIPMLSCEGSLSCMYANTWALPSAVLEAVGPYGVYVVLPVCWTGVGSCGQRRCKTRVDVHLPEASLLQLQWPVPKRGPSAVCCNHLWAPLLGRSGTPLLIALHWHYTVTNSFFWDLLPVTLLVSAESFCTAVLLDYNSTISFPAHFLSSFSS